MKKPKMSMDDFKNGIIKLKMTDDEIIAGLSKLVDLNIYTLSTIRFIFTNEVYEEVAKRCKSDEKNR